MIAAVPTMNRPLGRFIVLLIAFLSFIDPIQTNIAA